MKQKKPETVEECLICVRISRAQLLTPAFDVWGHDEAIAIADYAGNMIREIYLADPPFLCGKSPSGLIAGSLYLASAILDHPVRQGDIAEAVGVSTATIRNRYLSFMEKLGITHKDISLYKSKYVRKGVLINKSPKGQCRTCKNLTFPDNWRGYATNYGWYLIVFNCPVQEGVEARHNHLGHWRNCEYYPRGKLETPNKKLLDDIKKWAEGELKRTRAREKYFARYAMIPEDD